MNMENLPDLIRLIEEKVTFGQNLLASLVQYESLDGIQKLSRKILQEINFLKKVLGNNNIKKEYLQCTNLTHFSALVDVLSNTTDCISVNKSFLLEGKRLNVDIVADNGLSWIKVIARNPRSLSQICMGDTSYGVRSIIDQAEEFLLCAELYPCLFKVPKVIFIFANGIDSIIASELESLGVIVKGTILNENLENDHLNTHPLTGKSSNENEISNSDIDKINLDVSAMIAYVSSLTNGNCNFVYKVPVLTQQAEWERQRPVKSVLDKLFEGKRLFCCETAQVNFDMIVNTVGGPNEKIRAKEFMKHVIVLPDDATVLDTVTTCSIKDKEQQAQLSPSKVLPLGGKIKKRSKIIFRFGDNIQALTVTANEGFVRSAKQQGINFVVFIHESRALTEQKEAFAQKLNI